MNHITLEKCGNRTFIWPWEPVDKLRNLGTWTRVHAPQTVYHVVSTEKLTHDECRAVVGLYLSGRNRWVFDLNDYNMRWEPV